MCTGELKEKEIDGRERFHCPACGWINFRNPLPVVQCLVSSKKKEVLLIKRGIEPFKGHWSLPGGFVELEETVQEAGKRELAEETGLDGEPGRILGVHRRNSPLYGYLMIVGVEFLVENEDAVAGDDAEEARFFPREELPQIPFKSHLALIDALFAE